MTTLHGTSGGGSSNKSGKGMGGIIVMGHHSISSNCSTYGLSKLLAILHRYGVSAYVGAHPSTLKYTVTQPHALQLMAPSAGKGVGIFEYEVYGCEDQKSIFESQREW